MMADLAAFPKLTDLGLLLCDNDRHEIDEARVAITIAISG